MITAAEAKTLASIDSHIDRWMRTAESEIRVAAIKGIDHAHVPYTDIVDVVETPEGYSKLCGILQTHGFKDIARHARPDVKYLKKITNTPMQTLRQDLTSTLNRHSAEHNSHTPDFILAEYLIDCLAAYDRATAARTRFHHGVNETMEMVFNEPQLPATPTTPEPDLPPIGAILRFTENGFNCADEVKGAEVTVTQHDGDIFYTTANKYKDTNWEFHVSDWRDGLEIVKLPEA